MHPEEAGGRKKEPKHKCEICGKLFLGAYKLREHMPTHNDKPDPKFQCPICPNKFLKQENSFRKHMMNVHDHGQACNVDGCGKKFFSADALKIHQRGVHETYEILP